MSAVARVAAAFARLEAAARPEVWITLRQADEVLVEAAAVDARMAGGETLVLGGLLFAVKDNIDVAGLPTTAGAPSFAYLPTADATTVARLRDAGAIVLGKTNLDQFATGLVGTRSPYGAVGNAWDPSRISGGSSSGSAVATALGIVDFALGTDTAGSGRVPAALNGIYGVKPTKGLLPMTGVVPACYTLDCVTVFARELGLGRLATELMVGADGRDPLTRPDQQLALPARPRLAVPERRHLSGLDDGWAEAFDDAVARFAAAGAEIVEVDIAPLLEAADLLYDGAFVAERYVAVGAHIEAHRELIGTDLDSTVAAIVIASKEKTAAQWALDTARLAALRFAGRKALTGCTALLTPTTTGHPTQEQVAAHPVEANAELGRFTNFANLLDLAALALPAGSVNGLPFGVMLTGPAFSDRVLSAVAQRFASPDLDIFVVGAHLSGQPLNSQLVAAGGTLHRTARTSATYRLHALDTEPAKPGLVRVATNGTSIEGEVWRLPAPGFGTFLAAVPAPMTVGTVTLDDGAEISGFLVEPYALSGAPDISEHGGWRRYLAARDRERTPPPKPPPPPPTPTQRR